jgi:hypothetical protein
MNPKTDTRPTLNLGHLAIPNVSASQEWLKRQGGQREAAKTLVRDLAMEYFSHYLPDTLYDAFAERVVTELDHRV